MAHAWRIQLEGTAHATASRSFVLLYYSAQQLCSTSQVRSCLSKALCLCASVPLHLHACLHRAGISHQLTQRIRAMASEAKLDQTPEEPYGMEEQARLLTSLQEIPNISKCWLKPAHSGGLTLTVRSFVCKHSTSPYVCVAQVATPHWNVQVQYSQRNLPANSQRKYIQSTHIPQGYSGEHELSPSFPIELREVQLLTLSPSGVTSCDACVTAQTTHNKAYVKRRSVQYSQWA